MTTGKDYLAEYKKITIRTTDGLTMQGSVNIAANERVSELFTKDDTSFIILVDAVMREGVTKNMFINKNHIIWVEPEENTEL